MSDKRSYVALDWVNAQIVETLQQADAALMAFVADPEDTTQLRFSLTYIHQASGSLVMLELHAAALLSKEIEALIQTALEKEHAIIGQVNAAKLIAETLKGLAEYLLKVAKTHEDNPKDLLGLLNEIREANNQEHFSEADIFDPDIAVALQSPKEDPQIAVEEFNELIRKLRQSFQTGLIGIVRDKELADNYQLVNKVCTSLLKVSLQTASEPLWKIAAAITDQLQQTDTPTDIDSKKALKLIDNQLKNLEETGRDGLLANPDSALLKTLLYSVAKVDNATDAIAELKALYKLDAALVQASSEASNESAATKKVVHSIVQAIRQELEAIAEFDIVEMNDAVIRIQNTLRILSIADLLAVLQDIEQQINSAIDEGADIYSKAEFISQKLEKIDAFLIALESKQLPISYEALAEKYQQYVTARRVDLETIKETLAEYAKSKYDIAFIQSLPNLLDQQLELLAISPFKQLMPVVSAAYEFVMTQLMTSGSAPKSSALEALADAISSVDYYLERLFADSVDNLESILRVAEESVVKLQSNELFDDIETASVSRNEQVYDDNTEIPAPDVTEEFEDAIPVAAVTEEPALAEVAVADEMLFFEPGEDADEEIIEIFVEEAREVLEHIKEYLPVLEADYENIDALLEIRRSFHTLKGSGRMVGALHIGDFAWSVERMLNGVRDGIAKVTPNAISILHSASECVPLLVDGLEQRTGVSKNRVQQIVDRADAEWEGKPLTVMEADDEELAVAEVVEQDHPVESFLSDINEDEDAISSAELESVYEEEHIDEELLGIFLAEAESHIAVMSEYLDNLDPGYEDITVSSELQRALHTLKGSSHMAGVNSIAVISTPLESFVKDLNNFQTPVDSEILTILMRAHQLLEEQLACLRSGKLSLVSGVDAFIEELKSLHSGRIEKQEAEAVEDEGFADKYTALLSEALDCLGVGADLIQEWQTHGLDSNKRVDLVNAIYRLSGTAGEAKYVEIEKLAAALGDFYSKSMQTLSEFDEDFFTLANKAHDELDDMMNIIAAHQLVEPAAELIEELNKGIVAIEDVIVPEAENHKPQHTIGGIERATLVEFREQLLAADADTLEIFAEEAGELLDVLDVLMQDWFDNHKDRSGYGEILRIIHTLKGGARLTELQVMADLTHAYESCIEAADDENRFDDACFTKLQTFQNQLGYLIEFVVSGTYLQEIPEVAEQAVTKELTAEEVVEEAITNTDVTIEELEDVAQAIEEADSLENEFDAAFDMAFENTIDDLVVDHDISQEIPTAEIEILEPVEETLTAEAVEITSEEISISDALVPDSRYVLLAEQYQKADQDTLEIFLEEAQELDDELDDIVSQWINTHEELSHADGLKRILHTLKGGARLAELGILGDLTHEYESAIEMAEAKQAFTEEFFSSIQSYQDQVHQMVTFIANGANNIPMVASAVIEEPVIDEAATETINVEEELELEFSANHAEMPADESLVILAEQYAKADQDTLEIFMEEALELDAAIEEAVSQWVNDKEASSHADEMKRILHTLKGGARLAELSILGDLTHNFESMIESAEAKKAFDDVFFGKVQQYQDQVHRMIDFMASGAQAGNITSAPVLDAMVISTPIVEQPVSANINDAIDDVQALNSGGDDVDNELLALFFEEAKEQNEGIEECIVNLLKDRKDITQFDELKRLLHTLKGGARLTGLRQIGDVSHDFETFIINSEREKTTDTGAFIDELQSFHDQLTKLIMAINVTPASAAAPQEQTDQVTSNVVPIRKDITGDASQSALVSQAAIDATRAFIENFNKEQQRSNREPVKITPDLLEALINLAGESSIGRSRIEEQMNEILASQHEMDSTVDRLHNQLRRLEIETEAQIVFRQEQVVSEGQENFDPLEMDRYTHMQQLSKSLIESASDLDDISVTFTNKLRDMETLLLQQARINTELQEGLMRCQMVPFSRMVPRLRRIIRQIAQELGKKVEFEVENAEGELDRTILERLIAPLEHMLRNAVDHGIEMPDVRKAAGKPEQGTIVLELSREGGETVLRLRDDGAGVNIDAVRKKAIERGLMTEGAQLTDHELSQFILHAGFSTAQKVTQISGRGVGMDVVHSEIKQMGGSLDINSGQGKGSVFTIRVPFTVSVNRALMVTVGTDTYAIPLNTIEGIVRVSPYELEAYYQPDAPMFEYAGQSYNLRYMGGLLNRGHKAKLEGLTTPLPVVLVHSSDHTVAVQVDKLLGSREVVVKTLGPQFGMVGGLSGATVLGDGSVVIILDMLALIRTDIALGSQALTQIEEYVPEVESKVTTVMVVDDSVTVRKVTSRLLERFGMNVILAKDGLDALTQLQEMDELPDCMLLDIEMPRMDGFEVVSRVRHDSRLQHIPITMITSRTGDKHRERALSLGANRYLGKPFQERELLQTISELTGAEIQQA
jgi:chemosensory pili system protein ChpA (sensor histidine kinase/response regulator)